MELRQIKELMAAMGRHGMHRLKIKNEDFELSLERWCGETSKEAQRSLPPQGYALPETAEGVKSIPPEREMGEIKAKLPETFITSPMVGIFYQSPSPEDPPFVKVGDRVTEDTVVCIIEAMKVMNEVKSGVSGVIEELLMENNGPVEFGTKLFRIRELS